MGPLPDPEPKDETHQQMHIYAFSDGECLYVGIICKGFKPFLPHRFVPCRAISFVLTFSIVGFARCLSRVASVTLHLGLNMGSGLFGHLIEETS